MWGLTQVKTLHPSTRKQKRHLVEVNWVEKATRSSGPFVAEFLEHYLGNAIWCAQGDQFTWHKICEDFDRLISTHNYTIDHSPKNLSGRSNPERSSCRRLVTESSANVVDRSSGKWRAHTDAGGVVRSIEIIFIRSWKPWMNFRVWRDSSVGCDFARGCRLGYYSTQEKNDEEFVVHNWKWIPVAYTDTVPSLIDSAKRAWILSPVVVRLEPLSSAASTDLCKKGWHACRHVGWSHAEDLVSKKLITCRIKCSSLFRRILSCASSRWSMDSILSQF